VKKILPALDKMKNVPLKPFIVQRYVFHPLARDINFPVISFSLCPEPAIHNPPIDYGYSAFCTCAVINPPLLF
jgi:hypothetical protein